ncbi:MAG TPA: glycosyltransferase family 4 protein, partial [Anaerolineae bacterium]|nr:glycosyltransferase family 4 protein [Anaerolineae bacterium]
GRGHALAQDWLNPPLPLQTPESDWGKGNEAMYSEAIRIGYVLKRYPPPDLEAVRLHKLPALPKGELAAREQAALAANRDLRNTLEREGPFDVVYERYSLWSFAGMEYAQAMGIPGLLEVNAPLIEEQSAHRGLVNCARAERVAQQVFDAATVLIAVSEEIAAYLDGYPATQGRVHVVPNGVNPNRFPADLKPSCPARAGTFTVGFVGTLKPWHGLSVLVEAFAMLRQHAPNSRLLVVGDGPERERLETGLSARKLHEAAYFTGAVVPSQVPGLVASMDVAVAPYPRQSPFYFSPLKVYEYMAAGRAVAASRIGQLVHLIEDGVNGLLCPAGDPVALGAALDRLRHEPELRTRLGQAARSTVLRHHTWEAVARRLLRLAGLEPASPSRQLEVID